MNLLTRSTDRENASESLHIGDGLLELSNHLILASVFPLALADVAPI